MKKRTKVRKAIKRFWPLYLMFLPGVIYLFINTYIPMFGIQIAFRQYNARDGIYGSPWCGLKNFEFLFRTNDAFIMVRNTLLYNLVFIVLGTVLAVSVAIILNEIKSKMAKQLYQTVILIPYLTSVGTICNLLITTLYAYPLSRKELPGRGFFAFYLFFTMLFSGGLVPSYLMWTQTFHIRNTFFALLVPGLLMGAFNVIMMRTYFTANIPDAVIEAARVDGANEFKILFGIVLPMALPIIATIGLLVGLAYWNDWMNGLYYLNDDRMFSIQVLLMNIQRDLDSLRQQAQSGGGSVNTADLPSTSVRMALTVMGILPIMIIYPFMQKYFVKGIAIGAVKG